MEILLRQKKYNIELKPRGAGYAPHIRHMKHTVTIELKYEDGTGFSFEVTIEGKEHEVVASLLMITRGTLNASMARIATCFKSDGTKLCVYTK